MPQSNLGANENAKEELIAFMTQYQNDYQKMYCEVSYSWWDAMVTGEEEAFTKGAAANLALATYHSVPEKFQQLRQLREEANRLSSWEDRASEVALQAFEQNQFPTELMEKMINLSTEIERVFQTHRCKLGDAEYTNNELLKMLEEERDSTKRKEIWESLKEVGDIVAPRLIKLADLRNESARYLGYNNYWEMSVSFQDYKPQQLFDLFVELETLTTPIFTTMKAELDGELKEKFGVDKIMPWHYDNPFFQQAPPSKEVDANDFYKNKSKEEIVEISVAYFDSVGLDVRPVLEKSDLFEKPGKTQHAFCNNMNGEGDVRILCNIRPTVEWMDTQLHELGHAVYDYHVDSSLPFNLRGPAHIFTTEGIAMMFGASARNPNWMVAFAGVDSEKASEVAAALKKQRLREQLIFCRWTLVMLHFEKAFYENPDQDLNKLWWDTVEKYQLMPRPEDRDKGDWASKPHFVVAPVYYHNYMLGELFAAQLRRTIGKTVSDPKQFGEQLKERVFFPGESLHWETFVEKATGEPFSAKAFANELK